MRAFPNLPSLWHVQHGTWNVYRGKSTSSSDLVAYIEPSLSAILGKTIRIIRAGEKEPFLTMKVGTPTETCVT